MPVTSWTPQAVLRPVTQAFRPAAYQTGNVARALAPGPRTRAKTRVRVTGTFSAMLDARGVGPTIYPIIAGARPHEITLAPGSTSQALRFADGRFADRAAHPGSPPHPYLEQAARAFAGLYAANARRLFR